MKEYLWAINKTKLGRAISKAKQLDTEDEDEIQKLYISYGGLVKEQPKKRKLSE